MAIDVNTLSQKELAALINQAKKRQTTLKKRKPASTVRARLTALARAEGYTVSELFGGGASPAPRAASPRSTPAKTARKGRKLGKVEPKYRNPANAAETWTGRGKQPRWLAEMVRNGQKADEFLIQS
ncbi:MAG TPA: H-NS histone family protein [Luteimonas sp.]|nr:H-NS histone family protein [Luteimonas sp.]